MKNEQAKTRDIGNPYEVWETPDGGWEWKVLKKWQVDDFLLKDSGVATIHFNDGVSIDDFIGNPMTLSVLPVPKFKVNDSIVVSDTIFVMNGLRGKKFPTKMVLHNDSVFGFVFPITITELNKNQYIPLLSYGSTTFVVPSVGWDFESAGLTEFTSSIFEFTTLAEVLSFFIDAGVTDIVTPITQIFVTDFTQYGGASFNSHKEMIARYVASVKQYARWYCAVKSPFTHGSYEYGDVYVSDIKQFAVKVYDEREI